MYFLPYLLFMRLHRYAIDARRKERTSKYFLWSVIAGVSAGLILGAAVFLTWFLIYVELWWAAIPFAGLVVTPLVEPLLVRHAVAPLGLVKLAYWTARAETVRDPEGYSLVAAAWAHAHKP